MKIIMILALFLVSSTVHAQPLTPVEVSFMNFKTVDPAAICARLAGTSKETLTNLQKFAKYEALHNAHGGAANAKKIVECIKKSGLLPAPTQWSSGS